jgi:heptosyltransferase II
VAASIPARLPVKIAVRLPNWLGDTVMAVPAIRALRDTSRDAQLLLAGPWVELLAGQGLGDVLVAYPRRWTARLHAADTVRSFGADTVVLFPNSFEAAATARYWGGRRRIGFAGDGRRWLLTDAPRLPEPRPHQVGEYLRLVELLGAAATDREPRLTPPEPYGDTRQRARDLLLHNGAPEGKPMVGVHLGAAFGPAKVWVSERIAEFCRLGPELGVVPVLLGAPSDAAAAHAVLERIPAVSLVGRDSPDLLPSVLAEMAVLVAGDTGVAHLAAALGTPVVVLFGPTDPALSAPLGCVTVMRHAVPCAPCFYRVCPIEHPCMRGISAAAVGERVAALLSGTSWPRR